MDEFGREIIIKFTLTAVIIIWLMSSRSSLVVDKFLIEIKWNFSCFRDFSKLVKV